MDGEQGVVVMVICRFTDLATAHPMCFDASRYVPPIDWPSLVSEW